MNRREVLRSIGGATVSAVYPHPFRAERPFSLNDDRSFKPPQPDDARPALRSSLSVFPGESIALWGAPSDGPIKVMASAPAWRGLPQVRRAIVFAGSKVAAFSTYPFNEFRPVQLTILEHSQSQTVWLNTPRLDWLEQRKVSPRQVIRLFGRNLDCVESLTLRGSAGSYILERVDVKPFVAACRVPDCELGNYSILIDGNNMGSLEIVDKGLDPLKLSVWWSSKFNWALRKIVEPKHLVPYPADSTDTIQEALSSMSSKGGIIELPPGIYGIRTLTIPANVVLMGSDARVTTLKYLAGTMGRSAVTSVTQDEKGRMVPNKSPDVMLRALSGVVGIAQLALESEQGPQDDGFRRSEGVVQGFRLDADRSEFIFVSDVRMNIPNGSGLKIIAGNDIVVQRCQFVVSCSGVWVETRTPEGRAMIRECDVTNRQRPAVIMRASNSTLERNSFTGQNKVLSWCAGEHRIADLGPSPKGTPYTRQFISENHAKGVFGSPQLNDGEGLNYQMTSRVAYSQVSAADGLSVTDHSQSFKSGSLRGASIVIVKGIGLGQVRSVVDNDSSRIEVDAPWDPVPDRASIYSVDRYIGARECIIVNNSIEGVKKRAIDLYCKNIDNLIQDNRITNAGGIFLNATEMLGQQRLDMSYFNVIRHNIIIGQAIDPENFIQQKQLIRTDHGLNWGIRIGHIQGNGKDATLPSIAAYANEIVFNEIQGPMGDPRNAAVIIGIQSKDSNGPVAKGNMVSMNKVGELTIAVRLGAGVSETLIENNTCSLNPCSAADLQQGPSMLDRPDLFD